MRPRTASRALIALLLVGVVATTGLLLDIERLNGYAEHERLVEERLGDLNVQIADEQTAVWRALAQPDAIDAVQRQVVADRGAALKATDAIRRLDPDPEAIAHTEELIQRVENMQATADDALARVRSGDAAAAARLVASALDPEVRGLRDYLRTHQVDDRRKAECASADADERATFALAAAALAVIALLILVTQAGAGRRRMLQRRAVEEAERRALLATLEERRSLADSLAASQERYRSLVERLPAVIYVMAVDEQRDVAESLYVSPQSASILGVEADEVQADPAGVFARVHPDDAELVTASIQELARTGTTDAVEIRYIRPDGEEIWLRDMRAPINLDAGRRGVQGLIFDVTEARRAESERERLELELRLAQKLEAIGQLAAGLAHEINTPIQFIGDTAAFLNEAFADVTQLLAVYGELRAAAERGDVPAQLLARVREVEAATEPEYLRERCPVALDRISDGTQRVATIVRAMRDLAHPARSDHAPVDLNQAVRNTLIVAANEFKYVADVESDLDELPPVTCNGGELNQVLLNVIINAAHAVESVVADTAQRGTIRIRSRVDGDDVVISVSDSGGGIPAEIASRVFDPFFTTKEIGRGTGQGLAIARTIVVDRHRGSITFETDPGQGTTFHLRLPIRAESAVNQPAPAPA